MGRGRVCSARTRRELRDAIEEIRGGDCRDVRVCDVRRLARERVVCGEESVLRHRGRAVLGKGRPVPDRRTMLDASV